MATKKTTTQKDLVLHCKCDTCNKWTFRYNLTNAFYLKCATCEEEVELPGLFSLDPHAKLHWE